MKNCEDNRLCNPNLVPVLFTKALSDEIQTYVQIGPINQWDKRFKHLVNSRRMEKPLSGAGDCPHVVGCLTLCKVNVSWGSCAELGIPHKPDFKLAPGQKQVVSQDVKYGQPRKSDILDA
jgi:hypothetical protein